MNPFLKVKKNVDVDVKCERRFRVTTKFSKVSVLMHVLTSRRLSVDADA